MDSREISKRSFINLSNTPDRSKIYTPSTNRPHDLLPPFAPFFCSLLGLCLSFTFEIVRLEQEKPVPGGYSRWFSDLASNDRRIPVLTRYIKTHIHTISSIIHSDKSDEGFPLSLVCVFCFIKQNTKNKIVDHIFRWQDDQTLVDELLNASKTQPRF